MAVSNYIRMKERSVYPQKENKGDRRIRIIGSGAREHSLFRLIQQSSWVAHLEVAPGNAGTIGSNVPIAATDISRQVQDAKNRGIDTVIVGPEEPLALGIRNRMNEVGIDVFGPNQEGARIESDKWFAIQIMQEAGVPHPPTRAFFDSEGAKAYIRYRKPENIVVKENGLMAGKGVTVPDSIKEADQAVDVAFGLKYKSGEPVLVQDRIKGREASVLALVDKNGHIVCLPSSQDHKRVGENDTGLNTGGMGAFAPTPTITPQLEKRIMQEILDPIVEKMREKEIYYEGILYAGLMIDKDGNPIVIEFNCRGGDPEFPVISVLVEEGVDFVEAVDAVRNGTLTAKHLRFLENEVAVGIVAASHGYPQDPETGFPISGLHKQLDSGSFLFHAGTRVNEDHVETSGGRVYLAVGRGSDFREAKERATKVVEERDFEGKQFRRDIANNVIFSKRRKII